MSLQRVGVAVLGPLGTYTHEVRPLNVFIKPVSQCMQAAYRIFGDKVYYEEQKTISGIHLPAFDLNHKLMCSPRYISRYP